MDIEIVKKLIKQHAAEHGDIITKTSEAERYYKNENDIVSLPDKDRENSPIRNADNRVPHNFHGLLVNQKASYIFTEPPKFDTAIKKLNDIIKTALKGEFSKICKDLCINASNAGVSWLHYWTGKDGNFDYATVSSKEIIPVWSKSLRKKLIAAFRTYSSIDENGENVEVYEYWTETHCYAYKKTVDSAIDEGITPYKMFEIIGTDEGAYDFSGEFEHGFNEVPFIMFSNNNIKASDLKNIKRLIDTYDKTYSGFANDLEDIQEIIFILSGYEGTDLGPFLNNLKKYKTVSLESGKEAQGGLQTLTIDIPVEARKELLEMTRKAIFEQGQGIDPDPQNFGNSSGVALGYLYSLLELKAGLMETEFRMGFERLIKAICRHHGVEVTDIAQIWKRTSVSNDAETTGIIKGSVGIVSNKTLLQSHPLVEDAEKEMEQIKKEKDESAADEDEYRKKFGDIAKQQGGDGGE